MDWSKTFAQDLTDQATTCGQLHPPPLITVAQERKTLLRAPKCWFFDWAYKPVPSRLTAGLRHPAGEVVEQVRAAWKTNVKTVQAKRCNNNAGRGFAAPYTVLQAPIPVGAARFKQRVIYG
ncbi:hypothetical protein M8494_32505 [Serratia ureilytica]